MTIFRFRIAAFAATAAHLAGAAPRWRSPRPRVLKLQRVRVAVFAVSCTCVRIRAPSTGVATPCFESSGRDRDPCAGATAGAPVPRWRLLAEVASWRHGRGSRLLRELRSRPRPRHLPSRRHCLAPLPVPRGRDPLLRDLRSRPRPRHLFSRRACTARVWRFLLIETHLLSVLFDFLRALCSHFWRFRRLLLESLLRRRCC